MRNDINTGAAAPDDTNGPYGALVSAEGQEIPITREMIVQACDLLEPYCLSAPSHTQRRQHALLPG